VAHFTKLTSGKVRASVERAGVRKSATFATKREAEGWARIVETELLRSKGAAKTHTFEAAARKYELEVSAKKRGMKWEMLRITKMVAHFHGTNLSDIDAQHIAAWRDARLATGVSGSTVVRESKLLHSIFTSAKAWGMMDNDPMATVKMPRQNPPRQSVWTWQTIRRLLRFLNHVTNQPPQSKQAEVALAFLISLRTGMRAGEVLQVNPKSFNLTTRVVSLATSKTEVNAKVPLTKAGARLCALVQGWTIDAAMRDALFRKARDACLVGDLTFHDARATALTLLAKRVDVLTLARISRHKDLKMLLNTYYRETPEQIAGRL
jgi:integrase